MREGEGSKPRTSDTVEHCLLCPDHQRRSEECEMVRRWRCDEGRMRP